MTTKDRTNATCARCEKKGGTDCSACSKELQLHFWCESCRQAVAEKRCPLCGLKAKRILG